MKRICVLLAALLLSLNVGVAQKKVMFSMSAGLVNNYLEFGMSGLTNWRSGYLLEAGMSYDLVPEGMIFDFSGPLQLTITLGYHRWYDPSLVFFPSGPYLALPSRSEAVDIPLLAGVRWQVTNTAISPYISFEMGPHFISRDHQVGVWDTPQPRAFGRLLSSSIENESVIRFGYRIGMGVTARLNDNMQLDLSGRYNSILWNYEYDGLSGARTNAIRNLSLMLGVRFGL